MKEYRNYIFDLYGTLVDIHTDEHKRSFWKKLAFFFSLNGAVYEEKELRKQYHALVKSETEKLCKKEHAEEKEVEIRLERVFKVLYLQKGVQASRSLLAQTGVAFRAYSLEKLCVYEGATELLQRLQKAGKRIYLLSNAQRMFTEPEMRTLGLYPLFDGILYSSDVGYKKPSSRFYDALLQKYCLAPEESVMIGNEYEADIVGAFGKGLDSMYIYTEQSGFQPPSLPAKCREIKKIAEVF